MRNYVLFYFGGCSFDDLPNTDLKNYVMDKTPELVVVKNQALADNLATQPNVTNIVNLGVVGKRYFCLDKENLLFVIQGGAGFYWENPDYAPQFPPSDKPDATPRNGWKDISGEKRAPPPSEKKKSILSGPNTEPGLHSVAQALAITVNRLLNADKDRLGRQRFGREFRVAQLCFKILQDLTAKRITDQVAFDRFMIVIRDNPDLFPRP